MFAAFTTVVAGTPSPTKIQLNVLEQPNNMHPFAYITAYRDITLIHYFLRMSTRIGQHTTQWDG